MKKVAELFRAIFLSPEFVVALAAALIVRLFRSDVTSLAPLLLTMDPLGILSLLGLPLSLVAGTFALGNSVLHPASGRELLLEWPHYWRLKQRVWLGVAFSAVGVGAFWIGLYLVWKARVFLGASIGLAGLAAAVTALATVAVASFTVREILEAPPTV